MCLQTTSKGNGSTQEISEIFTLQFFTWNFIGVLLYLHYFVDRVYGTQSYLNMFVPVLIGYIRKCITIWKA